MTDDLVARLREAHLETELGDNTFKEAADRLEAAEARVLELEAQLAEAYERAAKVADGWLAQFAHHEIKYVSARMYASDAIQDIASGIRKLAQEVKHEAE